MTATGGLRYDRFQVNGHSEWLMRVGPDDGLPILFIPPLFEEMNRTRALLAAVMRLLATESFLCALPDLPGTGESERALEECTWSDWRDAVAQAALQVRSDTPLLIASFRGGALLDDVPDAVHWRLSPLAGRALMRDLGRSALTGSESNAGYPLSETLAGVVTEADLPDVSPCRTVRLASDPKAADAKIDGPALWRRSEPGISAELAGSIASDISDWTRRCASF